MEKFECKNTVLSIAIFLLFKIWHKYLLKIAKKICKDHWKNSGASSIEHANNHIQQVGIQSRMSDTQPCSSTVIPMKLLYQNAQNLSGNTEIRKASFMPKYSFFYFVKIIFAQNLHFAVIYLKMKLFGRRGARVFLNPFSDRR